MAGIHDHRPGTPGSRGGIVAVLAAAFSMMADSAAGGVDFEREVAPVLEAKCLACHNPNNLKGDLSMATAAEMRAYEDGELIVAGKARESLLHSVVVPEEAGEEPEMPKKGDPLTDAETDLLEKLRFVEGVGDELGLRLYWSGTHPFSEWHDQQVTRNERYYRLADWRT
ncbi:MAG: glutamate-cysteine ligase family protein [Verrucomicrobiales bacterium]